MNSELSREALQRIGVEFSGSNVILYHVTTAQNLMHILRDGQLRPANQINPTLRRVWTNPGEEGNDDRVHFARKNQIEGIAGHKRFRLENGGGLYVIRIAIPVDSPYLVPDQDTKEEGWRESLLHPFGTCAYKGTLQTTSFDVVGRFSPQPGEEEYMRIYPNAEKLQQVIERITESEREVLKSVGVVLEAIPLLDR